MNLLTIILVVFIPFLVSSKRTSGFNDETLLSRFSSQLSGPAFDNLSKAEKVTAVLTILEEETTGSDNELGMSTGNPSLHKILKENERLANECYDSSVGNENNVDFFYFNRGEVAKIFFQQHLDTIEDESLKTIFKRINALLDSITFVAKRTIECIESAQKDEQFKPTKLGLTPLAAYTFEEINEKFLMKKSALNQDTEDQKSFLTPSNCNVTEDPKNPLPKNFDWREHKPYGKNYSVVVPPKYQGGCGSCYVFGAVGAMESGFMLSSQNNRTNQTRFSEQPLLNCAPGNCKDGGEPKDVINKAATYGLTDEWQSKYVAKQEVCQKNTFPIVAKPNGYCDLESKEGDNEMLMKTTHRYGPSVVYIYANFSDFQYLRGPLNKDCPENKESDHAILSVGWTEEYLIAKNSWGLFWGIDGYLYLHKDKASSCRYNNFVGVPLFKGGKH